MINLLRALASQLHPIMLISNPPFDTCSRDSNWTFLSRQKNSASTETSHAIPSCIVALLRVYVRSTNRCRDPALFSLFSPLRVPSYLWFLWQASSLLSQLLAFLRPSRSDTSAPYYDIGCACRCSPLSWWGMLMSIYAISAVWICLPWHFLKFGGGSRPPHIHHLMKVGKVSI